MNNLQSVMDGYMLLAQHETNAERYLAQAYDKDYLAQLSVYVYQLYKNLQADILRLQNELNQQQQLRLSQAFVQNRKVNKTNNNCFKIFYQLENKFVQSQKISNQQILTLQQQNNNLQQQLIAYQQDIQQLNTLKQKIDQQKEKIDFYEDQIKQFQIHINKLINLNNQFQEKIHEKNDIQLQLQLQDQNKKMQIILLQDQIRQVNENSLKFDENCQQFKQKIQQVNNDRDQIKRSIEEILKQFESNHQDQSNQQQLDITNLQNIRNKIKHPQQLIELMERNLQRFQEEINLQLKNQNIQENQIIMQLRQILNGNIQCFIQVKKVLSELAKMLDNILDLCAKFEGKNEQLKKQLEQLTIENNKIKQQYQVQIDKLNQYNQQEQQFIPDQHSRNNFKQQNCIDISNKYTDLYDQFNEQIMLEISKILQEYLQFYLMRSQNKKTNSSNEKWLLHNVKQYIENIRDYQLNIDNNILEQQWKRSKFFIGILMAIYINLNGSILNEQISISLTSLLRIRDLIQSISKFQNSIIRKKNQQH